MINDELSMKPNIIKAKSFDFAVRVKLHQFLVKKNKEFILSSQILKRGTSIGANIEEADAAISKKEFSSKMSIAYKEAQETNDWLRLLFRTGYLNKEQFESITDDCNEICKLLFSIIRTTRIRTQN